MSLRSATFCRLFRSRGGRSVIMSNRSYVITPLGISEQGQGPIALVFGWAGSKDSHVAKYSKFYEDMNMTTIRYTTRFHWHAIPGPDLSHSLRPAFDEVNATEREIIVHIFSMNGCMTFISLWHLLDETENGRRIKQQIKGIVFDSCPSIIDVWTGTKVAAQYEAAGKSASLQILWLTYMLCHFSVQQTSAYIQSFWDSKSYERFSLYHHLLTFDMPKNQLYLYSKPDLLCRYETIDQFREKQSKSGNKVDYIRFEDSPHVGHGRKYPEQYRNALRELCKTSLSSFDDCDKENELMSKL